MSPLSVTLHRHDPAVAVVTLLGEHDSQSAGRLESELALLLDERVNLVADLSEATFLDYHALSVLLSARYRAEEEQLGFVLVPPESDSTQVHRTLEITGLESTFALSPTVDEALPASRAGRTTGRPSLY